MPACLVIAAFDGVAGDGASRQLVPIVRFPTELVDHWRERESRVRHSARDDDLRAAPQRLRHGERTEVNIRTLHLRANLGQGLARFHVLQLDSAFQEIVEAPYDVVARHGRDFDLDALPLRDLEHCVAACRRIDTARVGDHTNAALLQIGEYSRDHLDKVARIPRLGISRPLLLQDRHCDLGKIIERQIVNRAAPNLFHRSFKRVAPEALAVCDANHFG